MWRCTRRKKFMHSSRTPAQRQLALAATPAPPAIPWRALLQSPRCSNSNRKRDQHTRKAKQEKRHPVDQQHVQHARIHRTTASNHRLRMLRAEEPDRKINQRHVQRAKNRQRRRQHWRLRAVGESPQHQIAHINQPQHQRRSQPHIARRPPDSPHRPRPDRSRDQNDGAKNHAHFGRRHREYVEPLSGKSHPTRNRTRECKGPSSPRHLPASRSAANAAPAAEMSRRPRPLRPQSQPTSRPFS